jgi:pyruvate,water dikinase
MSWFRRFLRDRDEERAAALAEVQRRFSAFLALLDGNKRVLQVIADLEEKSQGEHLFDVNYIRASLGTLRLGIGDIVDRMVELGGEAYLPLRERQAAIFGRIEEVLEGRRPLPEDDYTIPLRELGRERTSSVGGKAAQLGELGSRLGLPIPDGFAISAWAYKRFVDENRLQERIGQHIDGLDVRQNQDLERASAAVQAMILESPVPDDLARAIESACRDVTRRAQATRLALRSSAVGEDSQWSFAGQYRTLLGVCPDDVVEGYRQVLAGKFCPEAIYYLLSHDLKEHELAMSVACVAMVDAVASGVIYTRDPVRPEDGSLLVQSVFGLGQYLVDGTLTPDLFRLSRSDGSIREVELADQPVRLVLQPDGTVTAEDVPEALRSAPSVSDDQLRALAACAVRIDEHYGTPQDIEWAVDRDGQLRLLQTRPLRVACPSRASTAVDVSGIQVLSSGGTTVCLGAGAGPVCVVHGPGDLGRVPDGAVVVSPRPFPGLVTVMGRARAIVTEVGGVASHMATLAREHRIPALGGVVSATELPEGARVTVDATTGVILAGEHPELVAARRPEVELFEDTAIFELLERVLVWVVPLHLLHPSAPEFRAERCQTLHDITRFAHQRAMEEIFKGATEKEPGERLGRRLETRIPLEVHLIYMDRPARGAEIRRPVNEEQLGSAPLQAFWDGVREEGWPAHARPVDLSGFVSVVSTQMGTGSREGFAKASFALLSQQYMLLSLHLGYHFTTFEAMCSDEESKNYIRMQFKGGGASTDRRVRRIALMTEILSRLGFEHASKGDFLDSLASYEDAPAILAKLRQLGRLSMLTKQLDMALSNDAVARWYTEDIARKLGLPPGTERSR